MYIFYIYMSICYCILFIYIYIYYSTLLWGINARVSPPVLVTVETMVWPTFSWSWLCPILHPLDPATVPQSTQLRVVTSQKLCTIAQNMPAAHWQQSSWGRRHHPWPAWVTHIWQEVAHCSRVAASKEPHRLKHALLAVRTQMFQIINGCRAARGLSRQTSRQTGELQNLVLGRGSNGS